MEELYQEGKVRAIGVCNLISDRLLDLGDNAKILPWINQIERRPHYQRTKELSLMKENLAIWDFARDGEDMEKIAALAKEEFLVGRVLLGLDDWPINKEFILPQIYASINRIVLLGSVSAH